MCEYMREKCQANIKAVLIMYGNGKFPLFHNIYMILCDNTKDIVQFRSLTM